MLFAIWHDDAKRDHYEPPAPLWHHDNIVRDLTRVFDELARRRCDIEAVMGALVLAAGKMTMVGGGQRVGGRQLVGASDLVRRRDAAIVKIDEARAELKAIVDISVTLPGWVEAFGPGPAVDAMDRLTAQIAMADQIVALARADPTRNVSSKSLRRSPGAPSTTREADADLKALGLSLRERRTLLGWLAARYAPPIA